MDALVILRLLHAHGVRLTLRADALTAAPASALTDELRALIRENRLELVACLKDLQDTTDRLLEAAERACDYWRDGPEAREQMRRECLETPEHLRADLLAHLRAAYGESVRGSCPRPAAGLYPCGP